jgi:hypothetical protein
MWFAETVAPNARPVFLLPLFAASAALAKPPPILHTGPNKPLGKRRNKP